MDPNICNSIQPGPISRIHVSNDKELQAWYADSINVSHANLRHVTWWPTLTNGDDLKTIPTTIIWLVSAQYAALSFGQYPYSGYIPSRPPLMRRLIPYETDHEYSSFLEDPQNYFLSALPSMLQSTKYMAVVDTLSTHSPDEEYIGEATNRHTWTGDAKMLETFYTFSMEIQRVEEEIKRREPGHEFEEPVWGGSVAVRATCTKFTSRCDLSRGSK